MRAAASAHSGRAADLDAIRAAYATGRVNAGAGSLPSIPILEYRSYNDPQGDIHDRVARFCRPRTPAPRERTRGQPGDLGVSERRGGPGQEWWTNLALDRLTRTRGLDTGSSLEAPGRRRVLGRHRHEDRRAGHARQTEALQRAVPVARQPPTRGGRASGRRRPEVPAEADRCEGLQGRVHAGRDAETEADVSRRRVRLFEARREPGARSRAPTWRCRAVPTESPASRMSELQFASRATSRSRTSLAANAASACSEVSRWCPPCGRRSVMRASRLDFAVDERQEQRTKPRRQRVLEELERVGVHHGVARLQSEVRAVQVVLGQEQLHETENAFELLIHRRLDMCASRLACRVGSSRDAPGVGTSDSGPRISAASIVSTRSCSSPRFPVC